MSRSALLLIVPGIFLGLGLSSCGGEETEAKGLEGTQRAREFHARYKEVDQEFRALPARTPEQFAAHTRIRTQLNSVKIQYRAKSTARLGTISRNVFHQLSLELDQVEELIKEYPRWEK